jgi:hypothetical protein
MVRLFDRIWLGRNRHIKGIRNTKEATIAWRNAIARVKAEKLEWKGFCSREKNIEHLLIKMVNIARHISTLRNNNALSGNPYSPLPSIAKDNDQLQDKIKWIKCALEKLHKLAKTDMIKRLDELIKKIEETEDESIRWSKRVVKTKWQETQAMARHKKTSTRLAEQEISWLEDEIKHIPEIEEALSKVIKVASAVKKHCLDQIWTISKGKRPTENEKKLAETAIEMQKEAIEAKRTLEHCKEELLWVSNALTKAYESEIKEAT